MQRSGESPRANPHNSSFDWILYLAMWNRLMRIAIQESFRRSALSAALLVVASPLLSAQSKDTIDFGVEVKPILARHCFACHGPDQAESGLDLTDPQTVLDLTLDSGLHAVVAGDPDASELLRRVRSTDELEKMPPEGEPLTPEEIAILERWIAQGAPWETHWAFRPAANPDPPAVRDQGWVRNPIDRFILAKIEEAGLQPAPLANRRALIRRAYYDLIGLPPTPEEVEAFVDDADPLAYERLIDRLLASPHYGEKWGRQWLDLVRYAESNSFERDLQKPNAWRFRDYVIRSFHDDKPYDQFVREQLAGDELPNRTTESIIASGYQRLGIWDDEPADPAQFRFDELDDLVSTTSQAFLGLTIGCARCHDHKVDPIPQSDYYAMVAFFHEVTSYAHRSDLTGNNQTDISPPELRARYAELTKQINDLTTKMTEIEQTGIVKMPGPDQRKTEGPEREKVLTEKLEKFLSPDEWKNYRLLQDERNARQQDLKNLPPRAMALSVAKCLPEPPITHVLLRGSPHAPGDVVEPRFPTLFENEPPVIPPRRPDATSSGRRLALANWMTSPENRLTSRVMVNRIWQFHFGRGIVRSSNNFGQLGIPPTHPELLDWLSHEFVRQQWRLKPMHRMIMLSATYRMSSEAEEKALAADPANDLFWRFNPRRLSAEELRDSLLALTGELNPQMLGPWFYPKLSQEVLAGQSRPGDGWGESSPSERGRRSIYAHVKRSLPVPILSVFDFPDTDGSCEARFATTQPAQALTMLNGNLVNEQATAFAERLRRESSSREEQVRIALETALSRPVIDQEVKHGLELMDTLEREHKVEPDTALELYCLVVLNLNEFLYLD